MPTRADLTVTALDHTGRVASVFRVKHTEDATGNMEGIRLEG